jgi:hypothetical protein
MINGALQKNALVMTQTNGVVRLSKSYIAVSNTRVFFT